MALPVARSNQRGGALTEALPVVLVLAVFVSGLLLMVYLMFARAWIQYQSEQALYCLAEARPVSRCRKQLEQRLSRLLKWGHPGVLRLTTYDRGRGVDVWTVEAEWKIKAYNLRVKKQLDTRRLLQSRALRW